MNEPELTPLDVRGLLRRFGLKPKKSLGQNFLIAEGGLDLVLRAAQVRSGDSVLEIGPGLGSLTRHLARAARSVVAVEIDPRLVPPLGEVLAEFSNVRMVQGDILAMDPAELMGDQPYVVVANLPYYITSAVIRHLLTSRLPPAHLTLTVQREVAERICARPDRMSLLAVSVQVFGEAALRGSLKAGAFFPSPGVDSAVVHIRRYTDPFIAAESLDLFFRIVRAGFHQRRKTLHNALSAGLAMPKQQVGEFLLGAGIDPMRRAETLALEEWRALAQAYDRARSR